jgi:hypothetical protein
MLHLRTVSHLLINNKTRIINNKNIIRSLSQNNDNNEIPASFYEKKSDIDETKKYNLILSDLKNIKEKQDWILIFSGTIYLQIIFSTIFFR